MRPVEQICCNLVKTAFRVNACITVRHHVVAYVKALPDKLYAAPFAVGFYVLMLADFVASIFNEHKLFAD